jgi:hypothetical protein
MSSFKEKSQVFIIGLMVGLIIAGGFFILKLDDYFKELSFYKSITKTFSSTTKSNENTDKKNDVPPVKEKQLNENKSKNKKEEISEIPRKNDHVLGADTLNIRAAKDSLVSEMSVSDDIVVRKDELLSTKTLEVFNLSPLATKAVSKDSLLQKVSGVRDDRNIAKQFFNIEFWQSPLNYKGYKMSKYKMVLYGITSVDEIKVFKLDDVIYLKNVATVYRLDYVSDFKQYERITDENIINKLK